MQNILVIGGGFAGMMAALNAADQIEQRNSDITVTLVSAPALRKNPRNAQSPAITDI